MIYLILLSESGKVIIALVNSCFAKGPIHEKPITIHTCAVLCCSVIEADIYAVSEFLGFLHSF